MELHNYLSQPAGLHLDFFKLDKRGNNPHLFPAICAFLNTQGGIIIIGVSREKELQQLTEQEVRDFQRIFEERALRNKAYLNPSVLFYIEQVNIDSNFFLIIDVKKSKVLHKSGEWLYKRVGSQTIRVEEPQEISEMYSVLRPNTESEILPDITESDLNLDLLNKARTIAKNRDSNHVWLTMSNDEILKGSNLAVYDKTRGRNLFRRAAVLILGKDETIARFVPGYKLDIFVMKENLDRWDDRKTFITNLIDTRIGALDFVKGNFQEAFFQEGDQRIDLRDRIFREVIANVIIHREYTNALPTKIVIYKDNVKATNPNIVHNKGQLDLVNFEHFPKNPFILKFFDNLGWSEEAGTGVRNISKYLKIYARGTVPVFIEDNPFITIIPLKAHLLGDRSNLLLDLFDIKTDVFDEKRTRLLGELPINPELDESEDKMEFIRGLIGTFIKNEGKLLEFKIVKKSVLQAEKHKLEGTLLKIGGNLLEKKGRILLMILTGLIAEMTLEEATFFSGFGSKESFRENYLNILRKNDLISLTIPDRPNDPNQKYIITEKGKKLIGGIEIA